MLGATLGASLCLPATRSGVPRASPRKACPASAPHKAAASTSTAHSPGHLSRRYPGAGTTLVHAAKLVHVGADFSAASALSAAAAAAAEEPQLSTRQQPELPTKSSQQPETTYPRAACEQLQRSFAQRGHGQERPGSASRERLQEEEMRAKLGNSYPPCRTSAGLSAHFNHTWIDENREDRWLQRAVNDAIGRSAGEVCADRARSLNLDTPAPAEPLRSWRGTAFMRDRPLRMQETEKWWAESRVTEAPLRILMPKLC